jgi:hypothetical protein
MKKPLNLNPLLRGTPLPRVSIVLSDARTKRRVDAELRFHRYSIRADNWKGQWWWGRPVRVAYWSTDSGRTKRPNLAMQRAARWMPF